MRIFCHSAFNILFYPCGHDAPTYSGVGAPGNTDAVQAFILPFADLHARCSIGQSGLKIAIRCTLRERPLCGKCVPSSPNISWQ